MQEEMTEEKSNEEENKSECDDDEPDDDTQRFKRLMMVVQLIGSITLLYLAFRLAFDTGFQLKGLNFIIKNE